MAPTPGGGEPLDDVRLFDAADLFVGNCVSSFTAMATRPRLARGAPVRFWGHTYPPTSALP